MFVQRLALRNFRNYLSLDLPLDRGLTVLHGQNAQGKTNLLEAIFMLSSGSSYRTASDREVIRWEALPEDRMARISAAVQPGQATDPAEPFTVELLVADMPGIGSKRATINGAGKRVGDLLGRLTTVFFGPEQLDLVIGSPHHRRDFLDRAISQVDGAYHRALAHYNRVLVQRNHLLKEFREREVHPDELVYWDEQMVDSGSSVLRARVRLLLELLPLAVKHHARLAPGRGTLELEYETKLFRGTAGGWRQLAVAEAEAVRAEYRRWLALEHNREMGQGASVVGPHRDDVVLNLEGKAADKFGSRGQQRTVALALKLAELDLIQARTGDRPVLLLDDVLSELDVERRQALTELISEQEQVLLTTTERLPLPSGVNYEVRAGTLAPSS